MSQQFKQSQVSQAVWPWQEKKSAGKADKPSLVFSLITLAIAWSIAGLFYYFNHSTMAIVVVCISSFIFFSAQFLPKVYHAIENVFQKLSHYVGLSLTWLTLVPFFYICFGIGRFSHEITGKDPMTRELDDHLPSYWHEREAGVDIEQYRRQF